jgi:hypothetical protein
MIKAGHRKLIKITVVLLCNEAEENSTRKAAITPISADGRRPIEDLSRAISGL